MLGTDICNQVPGTDICYEVPEGEGSVGRAWEEGTQTPRSVPKVGVSGWAEQGLVGGVSWGSPAAVGSDLKAWEGQHRAVEGNVLEVLKGSPRCHHPAVLTTRSDQPL